MNFCFAKYSFLLRECSGLTQYLSMLLLLLGMPDTQNATFPYLEKQGSIALSFSRFSSLSTTLPHKTIRHKNILWWNNASKLWGEQFTMPTQRIPRESKRQPLHWRNNLKILPCVIFLDSILVFAKAEINLMHLQINRS